LLLLNSGSNSNDGLRMIFSESPFKVRRALDVCSDALFVFPLVQAGHLTIRPYKVFKRWSEATLAGSVLCAEIPALLKAVAATSSYNSTRKLCLHPFMAIAGS